MYLNLNCNKRDANSRDWHIFLKSTAVSGGHSGEPLSSAPPVSLNPTHVLYSRCLQVKQVILFIAHESNELNSSDYSNTETQHFLQQKREHFILSKGEKQSLQ